MFVFLLLPVLVSGFIVCKHNPYYFYKLHRYQGQYLYFTSALFGVICLLFSPLIALLIHTYFINVVVILNSLLAEIWHEKTQQDLIVFVWLIILSFCTLSVSLLWIIFANFRLFVKSKAFKEATLDSPRMLCMYDVSKDNPMQKLLFDAYLETPRPLMLSLDSRKIYVGSITFLGEINERDGLDQDIAMAPLMSGYRDKDTLQVTFNTFYESVDTDIVIVIRQSQIITATWFDFEAYEKLNSNNRSGLAKFGSYFSKKII